MSQMLGLCSHDFLWPRRAADGDYYQVCRLCGVEHKYDWEHMRRKRSHPRPKPAAAPPSLRSNRVPDRKTASPGQTAPGTGTGLPSVLRQPGRSDPAADRTYGYDVRDCGFLAGRVCHPAGALAAASGIDVVPHHRDHGLGHPVAAVGAVGSSAARSSSVLHQLLLAFEDLPGIARKPDPGPEATPEAARHGATKSRWYRWSERSSEDRKGSENDQGSPRRRRRRTEGAGRETAERQAARPCATQHRGFERDTPVSATFRHPAVTTDRPGWPYNDRGSAA